MTYEGPPFHLTQSGMPKIEIQSFKCYAADKGPWVFPIATSCGGDGVCMIV